MFRWFEYLFQTLAPRMNGHVLSWHTTESEIRTLSAIRAAEA
jgi:hypothetical protein